MNDDRVAVVGMACRVPGAASIPVLWRNLCAGVDSVRRYVHGELAEAGIASDPLWVPAFGHLDELTGFDATLFGYGERDAALLDPQHRIFLEVAWWALEDAGYDPGQGQDQIGVFAGCGANRYLRHHLLGNPAVGEGSIEDWDDLLAGGTCDYLPARVAYALGLTGPSVAVQTACSSSLVAIAQAAQGLLDFRCDLAIAGGAAVVSTRQAGYRHRPGGTLASDGICRPYDAGATGQVFGNGGAAVVLKRLPEAIEDDDHIYAVISGWAVNNDGAERAGLTVPGVSGQAAVVAEALAVAGWDPAELGFIEGHGSGTAVGDAIEIEALGRALRSGVGECVLGSVKSSVGNLDAAAGAVSLIKAVLAVRHGVIPPTLNFTRAMDSGPFTISAGALEWSGERRAGVSSFGQGGTNAHVLLEQAPARAARPVPGEPAALTLSTQDEPAMRALAITLADHLAAEPDTALADVAYTLSAGRRRLPCRATVSCRDTKEAVAALIALAGGGALETADPGPEPAGRRIPLPGYPFQRSRHWIDLPSTDRRYL